LYLTAVFEGGAGRVWEADWGVSDAGDKLVAGSGVFYR